MPRRYADALHVVVPNVVKIDGTDYDSKSLHYHSIQIDVDSFLSTSIFKISLEYFGHFDKCRKVREKRLSMLVDRVMGLDKR